MTDKRSCLTASEVRSTNGPLLGLIGGPSEDPYVSLRDEPTPSADDLTNTVHVVSMMDTVTLGKPLDTKALAELLGLPVRTLEYWRARKPEPYGPRFWYAGKKVLYSPEDIKEWIDEQRGKRSAA